MEVNKIGRAGLDKTKSKQQGLTEKISFSEVMAARRNELQADKLNKLVEDIEDQGKLLAESRTVEDLNRYKKLVKEFMEEAIKYGLKLEERRGHTRRGKTKIYKIVATVDQKLLDLTDAVLKKQAKSLQILDMVGQIKGLLIDIYS
ncbi:YaaR family protein [Heliorestis acidaminivorans]|uniref:YaaR family protein n=1 Tax=Heliorestis acidaminivorans TaxID=553427 RepID=A0A6I0F117_9FIRM|nr:YaaR family protein [Heliorestis acidaminivorans]KAB2953611.1 YaaR family protein [Heliorestis acidaminivorans]